MCVSHRQLGESRIVDPASEGVLLELQELDNQPRQGFTGRGVVLDVLSRGEAKKKDRESLYADVGKRAENRQTLSRSQFRLLVKHKPILDSS